MSIGNDIRDWSRKVLEVPNDTLGGLPACPYAQQAWKQNKVRVVETKHLGIEAITQANLFDNMYDLVVVASYVPLGEALIKASLMLSVSKSWTPPSSSDLKLVHIAVVIAMF